MAHASVYNISGKQKRRLLTLRLTLLWFLKHQKGPCGLDKSGACALLFFNPAIRLTDSIGRCFGINDLMINEEIRDREVRVVDQNGEQLGVMSSREALALADERQLDLVKIAPQARPPVCKLMDYGKYRFEQSKKEREFRKNQKVITVKEVRLSATIEDHDVDVKYKNAVKFLKDGNKVKVTIRFRGRQITHSEIGRQIMVEFADRIKEYGTVDKAPQIEGRNMSMFISPKSAD